jgi:hypothetical protein
VPAVGALPFGAGALLGAGGVLHWPSMTIWPGWHAVFPGSAGAAGAQSIEIVANAAARSEVDLGVEYRIARLPFSRG